MTEGRSRPVARGVARALLAASIGMLAGAALNAALGEQRGHTGNRAARGLRFAPVPAGQHVARQAEERASTVGAGRYSEGTVQNW